jgi:hypothetical protein
MVASARLNAGEFHAEAPTPVFGRTSSVARTTEAVATLKLG